MTECQTHTAHMNCIVWTRNHINICTFKLLTPYAMSTIFLSNAGLCKHSKEAPENYLTRQMPHQLATLPSTSNKESYPPVVVDVASGPGRSQHSCLLHIHR